jgi:histidine triad (HIT) family protein
MNASARCPFCLRIEHGEYERTKLPSVVRFEPLNPVTPGHMLFVPRRHVTSAIESPPHFGACAEAAAWYGLGQGNVITSIGSDATQTVFHLHVHWVPRRAGDGLHLPWTGQQQAKSSIRPAPSSQENSEEQS